MTVKSKLQYSYTYSIDADGVVQIRVCEPDAHSESKITVFTLLVAQFEIHLGSSIYTYIRKEFVYFD